MAVDERYYLSRAKGCGMLRREICVDSGGQVVRYNLAYVNHLLYPGDAGRVLGYDSAHGYHHRHYKGKVTAIPFESFEQIEDLFQREWMRPAMEGKNAKD